MVVVDKTVFDEDVPAGDPALFAVGAAQINTVAAAGFDNQIFNGHIVTAVKHDGVAPLGTGVFEFGVLVILFPHA